LLNRLRLRLGNRPKVRQEVADCERLLPKAWVDLVTCPTCHGGGTERWMVSYKHACNRCGGYGKVARTSEAVRENEWTWN